MQNALDSLKSMANTDTDAIDLRLHHVIQRCAKEIAAFLVESFHHTVMPGKEIVTVVRVIDAVHPPGVFDGTEPGDRLTPDALCRRIGCH